MGSTGEPDRKRRHFSTLSPTAAAATPKKQPFLPISEDKKLDIAVLQFQNQKLCQKLETQKVEHIALENKLSQLKEKQEPYDSTLSLVKKSWEELVSKLDSCSVHTRESVYKQVSEHVSVMEDGSPSNVEDAFLSRLVETGVTESSSAFNCYKQEMEELTSRKAKNILQNVVTAINKLWHLKDQLHASVCKEFSENGSCRQKIAGDLATEVKNLRMALGELHLKRKSLARELLSNRDIDVKNKVELKRLRGELESIVAELEESNHKLTTLKTERDAAKRAVFPVLNLVSQHVSGDRVRDRQKDIQDLESSLKEIMDQSSYRLMELKRLHEERIRILEQLCDLQNKVKNAKCITSSQAFNLVRQQIEKSKSDVAEYQALFEKLQAENDNLAWREREWNIKCDLVDVVQRSSSDADSTIADLGAEIQKQIEERNVIEKKLKEAARQPGRKKIIAEFKTLVSSFPEEMGTMQSQLSKYKEAASDIHSLRADMQFLSSVLARKAKECDALSVRCADQVAEIQKLNALVQDLKESDLELKLILEMYRRESFESRDVSEARDMEYKAWAHVQSLKSSLDEHNLELRVKTANEAEAISQQRLAAAEAEIADMRQKLEASKREMIKFSDVLKSKNEENEAYLSEIETIGQAYDEMQTQNQHLLRQITERDDYNIKLVLEGVRAKENHDTLLMEKQTMEREIQRASASLNIFDMKAARIEDQLKFCSEHIHKLQEDKFQSSGALENMQRRLFDVRRSSQQAMDSLEEAQAKIGNSRIARMELQIDLERERFSKKRIEEELEVARRKALCLRAEIEGSPIVDKLRLEFGEYREIVKCSICQDRMKEVVITKCYHLFCNTCVQKVVESRHRKCPSCAASFGPNDVKPVYL